MRTQRNILGTAVGLMCWLSPALPMLAFAPTAAAADPFAAGVLACAAESDRDRRLDCYDRAVANFTARLTHGKQDAPAGAAPAVTAAPAAVAAPAATTAPAAPTTQDVGSAGVLPRHLAAKVSGIDYFTDHLVIHLDNSQVWEQVAEGQLNLHIGDAVTIDKQMGSYWLSGTRGGALQVKLKP